MTKSVKGSEIQNDEQKTKDPVYSGVERIGLKFISLFSLLMRLKENKKVKTTDSALIVLDFCSIFRSE